MPRQLAITKRVDLSDMAEGWSGCYVIVTPASYAEFVELTKAQTDSGNTTELVVKGLEIAKSHFVKGEVIMLNENGDSERVSMEANDLDSNREIADRVLSEVLGVAPNPKDSSTATDVLSTSKLSSDTSDTKTQ